MRGLLLLNTLADVDDFIRRYQNQEAQLLSSLTDGVHLHTLEANRRGAIEEAENKLEHLGILLPTNS